MTAIQTLFDRMWDGFRDFERDPDTFNEKMRVAKLREERRWKRRRICDMRETLDWEEKSLDEDEKRHGVLR